LNNFFLNETGDALSLDSTKLSNYFGTNVSTCDVNLVVNSNGCSSVSNKLRIVFAPTVTVSSSIINNILTGNTVTGLSNYYWKNTVNSSTVSGITFKPTSNGNYQFIGLDKFGCNQGASILSVANLSTSGTNTTVGGTNQLSITSMQVSASLSNTSNPIKVTITGAGFSSGVSVTVGGVALSNISVFGNNLFGVIPSGSVITNPSSPSVVIQNQGNVASNFVNIIPIVTDVQVPSNAVVFSIYPNPTNGIFTIISNKDSSYSIYSLSGNMLQSGIVNEGETQVSTELRTGFYLIKVGNGVQKLLIQ
jgi:hypothetical protein